MKRLSALGVELVENTDVHRRDDSSVQTSGGDTARSECTIWTAGFSAPDLAVTAGCLPMPLEGSWWTSRCGADCWTVHG